MPKNALQKQRWCVEVMSKANNREVEAAGSEGLPGEQRTNLFLMLVVFSLEGLSTCSPIDLSGVSQSAAVWKDQISQLFSQQLEEAVGTPVSAGAGLLPCAAWCLGINSHTLWPCLFPPPPSSPAVHLQQWGSKELWRKRQLRRGTLLVCQLRKGSPSAHCHA